MDYPSNEGALMTIGFLTFAVFLIKLVLVRRSEILIVVNSANKWFLEANIRVKSETAILPNHHSS